MIVDVQFNSATTPWPELRDAVLAAEQAGFGVAWVLDHLSGHVMGGSTMLECCTTVGALSALTSRIGIGTLVANVCNRSLGALAVAAATAQTISGGRFWLGVGAGTSPASPWGVEHRAVGIPLQPEMTARHQRVREFLALANEMWSTGEVDGIAGFPTPSQRIPVIVGVNSVALGRIAATEADGINIRGNHPRLVEIVNAAREARPLGAGPLLVTVWESLRDDLHDPNSPVRRKLADLVVDRLIVVQFGRADPSRIQRFE